MVPGREVPIPDIHYDPKPKNKHGRLVDYPGEPVEIREPLSQLLTKHSLL